MANYNKDYTTKTADEWFSLKKWTAYLMQIPIGKNDGRVCETTADLLSLRSTATMLSAKDKEECDRAFDVSIDIEKKMIMTRASLK